MANFIKVRTIKGNEIVINADHITDFKQKGVDTDEPYICVSFLGSEYVYNLDYTLDEFLNIIQPSYYYFAPKN